MLVLRQRGLDILLRLDTLRLRVRVEEKERRGQSSLPMRDGGDKALLMLVTVATVLQTSVSPPSSMFFGTKTNSFYVIFVLFS